MMKFSDHIVMMRKNGVCHDKRHWTELCDNLELAHLREVVELKQQINELRRHLKKTVECAKVFSEFLEEHPYLPKYLKDVIAKSSKALERKKRSGR